MKKGQKRDPRGRFVSRSLPDDSPSANQRDDSKKPAEDLILTAEAVAAELMRSRDKKLKATGAKLAVKIESFRKGQPDEGDMQEMPSHVVAALQRATAFEDILGVDVGLGQDEPISLNLMRLLKELSKKLEVSKEQLLKRMAVLCPGCERLNQAKPKSVSRQDS